MASTTDILDSCDQAFEDHYQRSASDPHNAEMLSVWRDAWAASRLQQGDAEMRADAERYRWLRDEDAGVPDGMRELCVVQFRLPFSDEPDTELFGRYLDEAIDAARQSSAGGEGQA